MSNTNPRTSIALPEALWETDPVQYLVEEKYPFLKETPFYKKYGGGRPGEKPSTGVPLGSLLQGGRDPSSVLADIESYRSDIRALPRPELESRVAAARARQAEQLRQQREQEEREQPFNQAYAKANFDHWAKCSYWTIDEMVALSLGREPRYAVCKYLESIQWKSTFAQEYAVRRDLIVRAKTMGQLWDYTTPSRFLTWSERMQVGLPSDLVKAVEKIGRQVADWKSIADTLQKAVDQLQAELREKQSRHMADLEKSTGFLREFHQSQARQNEQHQELVEQLIDERDALASRVSELEAAEKSPTTKGLGARERESLLKIIIGIACEQYGFNPNSGRNVATKQIADDMLRSGVPLDEDTVRKYLAEAKELLPPPGDH